MGQQIQAETLKTTRDIRSVTSCLILIADVGKSNPVRHQRQGLVQPGKSLTAWQNGFRLQNTAERVRDYIGDIVGPVIRLEHGNNSGKSREWQRVEINLPMELFGTQKTKRSRYRPTGPGGDQSENRLVAIKLHSALRLQFQTGQMRSDLAPHKLASIIPQERQSAQRIKTGWRPVQMAAWHHQHKRIAQKRCLNDIGWQVEGPCGDADIKPSIGHAFQYGMAWHRLQRNVALQQQTGQGDGQLWRDFSIEIVDDAKPQPAQTGQIHQGHGRRSAAQFGQSIAYMQKVQSAGTGQAQWPMAVINQRLPHGGFKFLQLLRSCRRAKVKIAGSKLQAARAGDFLKHLKAAQRNSFAKHLCQDSHFWLEYVLGQGTLSNQGAPSMTDVFRKSFTQQEPITEAAIARASDVMRSGRLHRYNVAPGETGAVAEFEQAFAQWLDVPFALALTSGGQALQIALRAAGVKAGDTVLTNGFTLAPVPGAIAAVGAWPILVETNDNLRPDLADLEAKAASGEARVLMLSNMRGHLPDMQAVQAICEKHSILLIEDCAHTMGATWLGKQSGTFGIAGCYSTQTYKHMNSGEGGILTSNDPAFMARATVLSGSYMLYGRHGAGPDDTFFEDARYDMPNCSARMDAIRATLLLDQIGSLADRISRWNDRYRSVEAGLSGVQGLTLPHRPNEESYVGSSIQFLVPKAWRIENCTRFVDATAARGVEVKWFGAVEPKGFTSRYDSWRYAAPMPLPATDSVLARLFDMRLPLTFDLEDCRLIAKILVDEFMHENQTLVNTGPP